MLSRTEWEFHNTQFDGTARHADEKTEHDETVKDDSSDVKIDDTSGNASINSREYSLNVNDKYKMTDIVSVSDPWRWRQELKFEEDGNLQTYIVQHVYYDGDVWRQTVDWDGMYEAEYEQF